MRLRGQQPAHQVAVFRGTVRFTDEKCVRVGTRYVVVRQLLIVQNAVSRICQSSVSVARSIDTADRASKAQVLVTAETTCEYET